MTSTISTSTPGLRSLLSQNSIPYKPFLAPIENEAIALDTDFDFIPKNTPQDSLQNTGLSIPTSKSTHLLYNFLLNYVEPRYETRASGPPTLICKFPFINASLNPPVVSKPVIVTRDSKVLYKVVMEGFILPQVILKVLKVKEDYEVYLKSFEVSLVRGKNGIERIDKTGQDYFVKYI